MKSRTKKLFSWIMFVLIVLIIPVSSVPSAQGETGNPSSTISTSEGTSSILPNEKYGKLPFYFEPNRGQTDREVRFLARGPGYTLFLTGTEAVLNLKREAVEKGKESASGLLEPRGTRNSEYVAVLRMQPLGANPNPNIEGLNALPGRSNYFIGSDPEKWRANIPHYGKVRYQELYPGIDLIFYGNPHKLEHDFVVKPGAKPESIRLVFAGAEDLEITAKGDLVLHVGGEEVRFQEPKIYQEIDGRKITIPGRYLLLEPAPGNPKKEERAIGFQVASYDRNKPLVIDPVLSYSTYLGGELGLDAAFGIAVYVDTVNNQRYAYVTGNTSSIDFPTTEGAFDNDFNDDNNPDAFVTKVNDDATSLVYSTFLGGETTDSGWAVAVDDTGSAYVVGSTSSDNFPTTLGAYKTVKSSGDDFIAKLGPDGDALVYSTFFGGDGSDDIDGITLDASGNAYLVGETESSFSSINTAGASVLDNSLGGSRDIFIATLNAAGSALDYFTYLGGSSFDDARGGNIVLDESGAAHIIGRTGSDNFPTTPGAFDNSFAGVVDIVVVKVRPDGSPLQYSTYLGGSSAEFPGGIALGSSGHIFVAGETPSADFPTTEGAFDDSLNSFDIDAFVAKVNPAGAGSSDLLYSTFLGGSSPDRARDIAVGRDGLANVTGDTQSTDFPTTPDALKAALLNDQDIFMTKVKNDGSGLLFSTVLGGETPVSGQFEFGYGIAVDDLCDVYLTGSVSTSDFPVTEGVFQENTVDLADAFVSKISMDCSGRSDLIVDFGFGGIWVWMNDAFWTKLHPTSPDSMATGDIDGSGEDETIIDFGSSGIWVRYNNSSWVKLHPSNPDGITTGDLDGNGQDEAIIDFGSSGIWVRYNDASWTKLHPASPELIVTGDMDGSGEDEAIIDFGSSGIWVRYNNSSWVKLHPSNPDGITTGDLDGNGRDEVIIDFGSSGIWVRYNDASWTKLHPRSPELIVTGDMDGNGQDEAIIDFGSSGIWVRYNETSWSKLHPTSPDSMVTGDLDNTGQDEVIIDFGSSGIWFRYNDASWTQRHRSNPNRLTIGNMDGI